jgi:hypothetical protein
MSLIQRSIVLSRVINPLMDKGIVEGEYTNCGTYITIPSLAASTAVFSGVGRISLSTYQFIK